MRDFGTYMLNQPIDISKEFGRLDNTYFNANHVSAFDEATGCGQLEWKRYLRKYRTSFNCVTAPFEEATAWEFPAEYALNEVMDFKIEFITDYTIRLRFDTKGRGISEENEKLMIPGDIPSCSNWVGKKEEVLVNKTQDGLENNSLVRNQVPMEAVVYTGKSAKVILYKEPFNIEVQDLKGNVITRTYNIADSTCLDTTDPTPFSYVRRVQDMQKNMAATFRLQHDEKIYGCGESFTRLNKRGQKIHLWTYDALGAQSKDMYKPIPFYLSSAGYGMFVHTSTPMTFDFGHDYDEASTLYVGDDQLDLFIFLGEPKQILEEYTALTGRGTMPPDWSFGLWMSRITYDSEKQARDVAARLREEKVPCDVIHLDTGWFEEDWKCNYKFSSTRFDDADKMLKDLKDMGYHISLWQLPYITPTNELFEEAVAKGYIVKDIDGKLPTEDAIIDFSNPEATAWYQGLLKGLLEKGVDAIKVDFGEGAPYMGRYHSGKTGRYEHNLYPLRYNKAAADITKEVTGENIIWARSTWAGSQRYPLHWGGDAEITDSAMAGSLRGGLSLGLCGFSFWSHDMGGFTLTSPEELYTRWAAFGMLTSHSRCHGNPPKEPWEYSEAFTNTFRKSVELKYALMPYIKEQSLKSIEKGHPLLRTLFFEYPQDETAWYIEDAYFFGEDILVAPLMKANQYSRKVYLPEGIWVDYFTREEVEGGKWHTLSTGEVPIIVMVKKGAQINHVPVAQCTRDIEWDKEYSITY